MAAGRSPRGYTAERARGPATKMSGAHSDADDKGRDAEPPLTTMHIARAVHGDAAEICRWFIHGQWRPSFVKGLEISMQTRPMLEACLRENLQAIAAQTRKADQIVVVDNDSTDGTPEMVLAEFPETVLSVRVVVPSLL